MTVNRAQITKQLIPGLHAIFGKAYKNVDGQHKVLFDSMSSKRSFEEEQLITGLGQAVTKREGEAVQYDDFQEGYNSRYVHETIALAFALTEEAVEDNLYESMSQRGAYFLGRSMANTKQIKAANVFNFGFDASRPGGDGVPLFSAAHPTVGGQNQSNYVTTDMSETALETATIDISLFKDDRGILVDAMSKSLHIPPALRHTVHQILRSDLSTTTVTNSTTGVTNTNDTNSLKDGGYFPGGFYINQRFTDSDAWFIRTDCPDGTKHFIRVALQRANEGDFDTGNFKFKARERYSFGWSDWRQWYGSDGSAT